MTEYIERKAVINDIGELFTICHETLPNEYGHHFIVEKELQTHLDFVRNLPAADVAPVQHGRWLYFLSSWENIEYLQCSICKKNIKGKYKYKYCPHCGAKMDGDGECVY